MSRKIGCRRLSNLCGANRNRTRQRRLGPSGLAAALVAALVAGLTSTACRPAPPRMTDAALVGPAPVTALVGATVIDGTGAPARRDATVLIRGRLIQAVGARRAVRVPAGATVIDGRGLFVLPGFLDLNVHTNGDGLREALQYGVTTVHDTYGMPLSALRATRDSIRAGQLLGARLLFSYEIFGADDSQDLVGLDLDSLRTRIDRYLDTGIDFIKYFGTGHGAKVEEGGDDYLLQQFSTAAQRVIVEEAHKRGVPVETHAVTAQAVRSALLAGVDLVQHPEVLHQRISRTRPGRPDSKQAGVSGFGTRLPAAYTDEVARLFVRQGTTCALIYRFDAYPVSQPDSADPYWRVWNANRRKLIRAGCNVVPTSDAVGHPGLQSLHAIEELVPLGMTPMQAIIAATRNGARACRLLDRIGTVEAGKLADLVVLGADPLQDIKHLEQIVLVFAEGRRVPLVPSTRK